MEISMKLVYQYLAIFFNFSATLNHLHPLQVENCDSNSRLVVDEDDNGKFSLEKVNRRCRIYSGFHFYWHIKYYLLNMLKIKYDINQQYLKTVYLHFVKSE